MPAKNPTAPDPIRSASPSEQKYAKWFIELRAEFAKHGSHWKLWGKSADPADSCWRDLFDEGMSAADAVDEEISAAGA
jgi:hypothetical protein